MHGQKYCYRILAHFSQLSPNGLVEYDVCETVEGFVAVVNVIDSPIPRALFTDKTDVTNCVMKVIELQALCVLDLC